MSKTRKAVLLRLAAVMLVLGVAIGVSFFSPAPPAQPEKPTASQPAPTTPATVTAPAADPSVPTVPPDTAGTASKKKADKPAETSLAQTALRWIMLVFGVLAGLLVTVIIVLALITSKRAKWLLWIAIGLGIVLAVSLLVYFLKAPVGEWWAGVSARTGEAKRTALAPAPKQDWRIVVFFPKGNEKAVNPATLTENASETKVFVFYDLRGGKKDDHGTVRIQKVADGYWEGEYRQPGGWGKLILTTDEKETHFTGKWSSPDSANPEWQKGGNFQIIKQ